MVGLGVFLQADNTAGRAGTAPVQPVTVGVQTVLDVVGIDADAVGLAKFLRVVPGVDFQLDELKVVVIALVAKDAVRNFVEQRPIGDI